MAQFREERIRAWARRKQERDWTVKHIQDKLDSEHKQAAYYKNCIEKDKKNPRSQLHKLFNKYWAIGLKKSEAKIKHFQELLRLRKERLGGIG